MSEASMRAVVRSIAPEHLDYEQLAAYADGSADAVDREVVDEHAADCAMCKRELDDLIAFRVSSKSRRMRWIAAAAAAAAVLIVVVAGERSVTTIADGGRTITIRRGAIEGLPEMPRDLRDDVERAMRGGSVTIRSIPAARLSLRGPRDEAPLLHVIEPIGCVVVTDRPTFQWTAVSDATYSVSVFDSQFRLAASSGPLTSTSWTIDRPLAHGGEYVWQITTTVHGREITEPAPPEPMARFGVIDARNAAEIASLAAQNPPSHLALGIAYARAGAAAEAERELAQLAAENHGAPLVERIRQSVRLCHSDT